MTMFLHLHITNNAGRNASERKRHEISTYLFQNSLPNI